MFRAHVLETCSGMK